MELSIGGSASAALDIKGIFNINIQDSVGMQQTKVGKLGVTDLLGHLLPFLHVT